MLDGRRRDAEKSHEVLTVKDLILELVRRYVETATRDYSMKSATPRSSR
jgi:hypothetical protein